MYNMYENKTTLKDNSQCVLWDEEFGFYKRGWPNVLLIMFATIILHYISHKISHIKQPFNYSQGAKCLHFSFSYIRNIKFDFTLIKIS